MSKELTKLNFEVKAVGDNPDYYHIEGIASTPDIDNAGDVVTPEAMVNSFKNYGLPKFPHQHDLNQMPLGVWDSFELRGDATILKGRIPRVPENEKLFALIEMGAYGGLSIGFVVMKAEDVDGNDITGRRNFKGIRIIKEIHVFETSLVTVPCNEFAEVLEIKSNSFDPAKIAEIKSFYDEQNKGDEMKIESKGLMLAKYIEEKISSSDNSTYTKDDWIAYIARLMSLSESTIEEMIAGNRDLQGEEEAYSLAWALDTYSEVIRQIGIQEELQRLGMYEEDQDENKLETKNRFANCESLSDIETVFKTLGLSIKESQTAISKVKSNLKLPLSDLESSKQKKGVSDSDLEQKTEGKLTELEIKSIDEALSKFTN